MNLQSLTQALTSDTLHVSLPLFRPELVVCATIVIMLFARIPRLTAWIDPFIVALSARRRHLLCHPHRRPHRPRHHHPPELFTGMLVYDSMTVFFRLFLLVFAFAFIILVRLTGLADRQDGQDFYTLLLGSTLGMCLMASANHLMTIFLGVEMASVPSYVLAGIIKGRRSAAKPRSSTPSTAPAPPASCSTASACSPASRAPLHLPTMANKLAAMDIPSLISAGNGGPLMVLVLAGLMIMVGLAFKLSAVPFHFWCPDVFEGASAEVDAFLSVASKAAAMALLLRVALGLGTSPTPPTKPTALHTIQAHTVAPRTTRPRGEAASAAGSPHTARSLPHSPRPPRPVRHFIVLLLAIVAAVTCTFGNLAAYGQTNIKRLLAYSTIAHAGYMIMAVAAAVQLAGTNVIGAREAVAALLFYLSAYIFMNLGGFAIVAFLRNTLGTEEIADYAGLIRSTPFVAVAFTAILVSLVGIPPMVGFMGKFAIFQSLVVAGGFPMIALLVIAGINTAISLVYYLRVAKVMCIDVPPADRGPVSIGFLPAVFVFVVALPVLYFGMIPARIFEIATHASQQLLM